MRALLRFSIRELLLVTAVVGLAIALFRSEYERRRPFLTNAFLNNLEVKKALQRIAAREGRSQAVSATGGLLNAREYGGTYTIDLPASEANATVLALRDEVASELLRSGCTIENRREGSGQDYTNYFGFSYACGHTAGALYVYVWSESDQIVRFYVFAQESKK